MSSIPTLTDRDALARNRRRAGATAADFLHRAAQDEIQERLNEVNRTFTAPAIVAGHDLWSGFLPGAARVADRDLLDLTPAAHDLVIHGLCLHWANDPVGQLIQSLRALRPDGLFIAAMFGGQTLHELRGALAEAESRLTGGLSPRVLPMAEIRDLGGLLQRAGFARRPNSGDIRAGLPDRLVPRPGPAATPAPGLGDHPPGRGSGNGRARSAGQIGPGCLPCGQNPLFPEGNRPEESKMHDGNAPELLTVPHAPASHPRLPKAKIGVLLANLGTPDATDYWSMRRYLGEFLSDRRVIDYSPWLWQPLLQGIILTSRPFRSGANYRTIWNNEANESPLMTITKAQTAKIRDALAAIYGGEVEVDFCMRYGNPSTASKVRAMIEAGCRKILFFPLYPQYAGATVATANDAFFKALLKEKWQPPVRTVPAYFDRDDYIGALAGSVRKAYAAAPEAPQKLLCSYHGLPERYLTQGDPYHCQCHKTTRLLKQSLGWQDSQIATTFQSKFGPEEWLKPYTVKEVARLAREEGIRRIAVIAPAFSADCIETLEEINGEIREAFQHAGGESFTYVPCLNDDPAHIDTLVAVIRENLAGWIA
jgi:ferrochelatase